MGLLGAPPDAIVSHLVGLMEEVRTQGERCPGAVYFDSDLASPLSVASNPDSDALDIRA